MEETISSLGESERKRLLEAASPGLDRALISLILDTGLKVESLIDIKVSELDIERSRLMLSPGNYIKLSPEVVAELTDLASSRPGQSYLFEGRCGKPVTAKWKRCVLEKLAQKVSDQEQAGSCSSCSIQKAK